MQREALALATSCLSAGLPFTLPAGATLECITADQALSALSALATTPLPPVVAVAAQRLQSSSASLQVWGAERPACVCVLGGGEGGSKCVETRRSHAQYFSHFPAGL